MPQDADISPRHLAKVQDDACRTVDDFVRKYRVAAIPALIGACVLWAVDHGGADTVRGTLTRAIKMSREMEAARKREQN